MLWEDPPTDWLYPISEPSPHLRNILNLPWLPVNSPAKIWGSDSRPKSSLEQCKTKLPEQASHLSSICINHSHEDDYLLCPGSSLQIHKPGGHPEDPDAGDFRLLLVWPLSPWRLPHPGHSVSSHSTTAPFDLILKARKQPQSSPLPARPLRSCAMTIQGVTA